MSVEEPSLRTEIRRSLASGEFSAAILWGALACGFLSLLEYNLTTMHSQSATISYAPLVGGAVAGLLYAGPRSTAGRAGAYASATATLALAIVLLGLYAVEMGSTEPLEWTFATVAFGAFLAIPLVTGFAAVFGYFSAHVTHWGVERVVGPRGERSGR